jgi:hypothetical protein
LSRRPFKATAKNMDLAIVMGPALLPTRFTATYARLHVARRQRKPPSRKRRMEVVVAIPNSPHDPPRMAACVHVACCG